MPIDYIFEGTPPKLVPGFPSTGWDKAENIFYVSDAADAVWVPVGGGVGGGPIIQGSATGVNVTTNSTVTITAAAQVMYAVSLYAETTGTAGSGHTVVANLIWTSPVGAHQQPVTLHLDGGISVVVETFPILCAAGTPISMTFTYGGGATNDPYTYSVRIVEMP